MNYATEAKLNYLGETKNLIRAAIENKGQYIADTDTFRSYADKIAAIQGGGGGLPAGLYWEQTYTAPLHYNAKRYILGGDLYLLQRTGTSNASSPVNIYKLVNGTYTAVASNITHYYFTDGVEFNGKLHILAGDYSQHWIWDGSTMTALTNLPFSPSASCALVWNGELCAVNRSEGVIYKWVEDGDTWEVTDFSLGGKSMYGAFFVHNGEMYRYYLKKLYLCDGAACTEVGSFTPSLNFLYYRNGSIYFYSGNYMLTLYEYDIENAVLRTLGTTPFVYSPQMYEYQGRLHLADKGTNTMSVAKTDLIWHEVTG